MTRVQRLRHARAFYVLTPVLVAQFAYAFVSRHSAAAHLRGQPVTLDSAHREKTP